MVLCITQNKTSLYEDSHCCEWLSPPYCATAGFKACASWLPSNFTEMWRCDWLLKYGQNAYRRLWSACCTRVKVNMLHKDQGHNTEERAVCRSSLCTCCLCKPYACARLPQDIHQLGKAHRLLAWMLHQKSIIKSALVLPIAPK